jgi:protein tyrosine phosphatase
LFKNENYEIDIILNKEKSFLSENVDRRVFDLKIKFKETDQAPAISQTRSVEHIHYKSWVDMSVPDA